MRVMQTAIVDCNRVIRVVKQQCPDVDVELIGTRTDDDAITIELGGFTKIPSDLIIRLSRDFFAETTCAVHANRDDLVVTVCISRFHERAYSSLQLVLALALILYIVHWVARLWYGCTGHVALGWIDSVVPGAASTFARKCSK